MQEHIGIAQLLERRLEGLDKMRGQLADKADGIGEQHLLRLVDAEAPGRGIEGVKQAVVRGDVRAGKAVEQRGFARVRIPHKGDDGHGVLLALAALGASHLAHIGQLLLKLLDLAADMAAVGLKLSFAGAARTDRRRAAGGGLADKVRPHTCQAREQVFILRKLYLKLTLARLGALGKDIQYEPGAVEHLDAELLGQHAHLRGAEFVVEHGEVAVVHRDKLFHFPDLAVADEAARIRRRAALHEHGDSLAPRRLDKGGKLLH